MTKTAKTIEVTDDMIANGAKLDAALVALDNAKRDAHETAIALKAVLCPKGETKDAKGRFLPHIAAFLDGVFAEFEGTDAARKMRRMRLMQVIASTSKEALGKTQDAAAKKTRKPRPATVNKAADVDDEGNEISGDDTTEGISKSAQALAASLATIASIEKRLHSLQIGTLSRLATDARKGANAELAEIRKMLNDLRALIA